MRYVSVYWCVASLGRRGIRNMPSFPQPKQPASPKSLSDIPEWLEKLGAKPQTDVYGNRFVVWETRCQMVLFLNTGNVTMKSTKYYPVNNYQFLHGDRGPRKSKHAVHTKKKQELDTKLETQTIAETETI